MSGCTAPAPGWDWTVLRAASAREARRLVQGSGDVDEVTQEAIIRAWRGRGGGRAPDNPLPWVLAITRREAYRYLARRAIRSRREGAELSDRDSGTTQS